MLVYQPTFSNFFSQKGLIHILNIMVGHFADKVVNWLAKLLFIVSKTEKSSIYKQTKFNFDQVVSLFLTNS